MALTSDALFSSVYLGFLSMFPDSVKSKRKNDATGVPVHNPSEELVRALCTGFVSAMASAVIRDIGEGDDALPGTALPTPFVLPNAPFAETSFLSMQGWQGENARLMSSALIGGILQQTQIHGLLYMRDHRFMGNGQGIVSPEAHPNLHATLTQALETHLTSEFSGSGFFSEADVPGNPVNATLASQIPSYASALAIGVSSIVAEVTYIGGLPGSGVSGVINTGSIR
jgi:hypothetical protein